MNRFALIALLALTTWPAYAAKKPAPAVIPPPPPAPAPDPEAWRASPPPPAPKQPWSPPIAQTFALTNGIPVYLVENPGLPLVSVNVLLMVGREANPVGKGGLAALTANLLDEGTSTRPGRQLAADAAMLGASLSSGQGDEVAWATLEGLSGATLGASLDLLAEMTLEPAFSAADFERVRAETLTGIQAARAEPRDVARRAFAAQLFGSGHPYGVPTIGDTSSVARLRLGEVKSFYSQWWHARNAAIVVAGAVTLDEVKPMLEARFGRWKAHKQTRASVPAPAAPARTRLVFVEQPGAVQSVINVGTAAVSRTHPDYMATNVAGTLLAGMFSSPVNMNLREDKGWSYGAFGGLIDARDHGTLVVRTSVQADKTGPAVTELLKEFTTSAARTPTVGELNIAKDYLRESIPANFETNSTAANSFANAPTYGLPADLWRSYITDLNGVSPEQTADLARRFFDPARQLVVVAGPRTVELPSETGSGTTVDIVADLKALGYEFVELNPK